MNCRSSCLSCREIRDLKTQLSSQQHGVSSQSLQEVVRERDAVRADRNRLLGRVLQLEKDASKLDSLERLKAAAVSAYKPCIISPSLLAPLDTVQMLELHIKCKAALHQAAVKTFITVSNDA